MPQKSNAVELVSEVMGPGPGNKKSTISKIFINHKICDKVLHMAIAVGDLTLATMIKCIELYIHIYRKKYHDR